MLRRHGGPWATSVSSSSAGTLSSILAVFGEPVPTWPSLADALTRMRGRGAERIGAMALEGGSLAVARAEWEEASGHAGAARVERWGRRAAVADATLYYRGDLATRLSDRTPEVPDATAWIAAAYDAWGSESVEWLEGDFAFAVWDEESRELFCARDFGGKRPLYFAELPGRIVVASQAGALLALLPSVPEWNGAVLAEHAADLWGGSDETCWQGVRELPSGCALRWSPARGARTWRWWRPPLHEAPDRRPLEDAAADLRDRLARAVAERLDPAGTKTAVWMSGGWDSTAVFGAGMYAGRGETDVLQPVSVSYPPGDSGREDEYIDAIGKFWNTSIRWVPIAEIPYFDRPAERAAARDVAFVHHFELWNRRLVAETRALNARVALDGNGGDQLFQVSEGFLADLLFGGRWLELRREWQARGGRELRRLLRFAIGTRLGESPSRVLRRIGDVLMPMPRFMRYLPDWFRREYFVRHGVLERERACLPKVTRGSVEDGERWFALTTPYTHRAFGSLAGIALEDGVELRSPLLDARVVDLACRRPREDRSYRREIKRLPRTAMAGLLPAEVLEPRPKKTGTTTSHFLAETAKACREAIPSAFRGESALADMGIIETAPLLQACGRFVEQPSMRLGPGIVAVYQTELWLRARTGTAASGARTHFVTQRRDSLRYSA